MIVCIVVHFFAEVMRKEFQMDSKGNFELMKFRNDNMCKQVLTANDVKEMGKIKILQTTDIISMIRHVYL